MSDTDQGSARDVTVPATRSPSGQEGVRVFPFRFTPGYRWPALLFGIGPDSAQVTVSGSVLDARFGPWRVTTPVANIARVERTGPYRWHRTAGSARYSLADHGLTFATNGQRGLCLSFHVPVTGLEPTRSLRHPDLTVTVDDVDGLDRLLAERPVAPPVVLLHPPRERPNGRPAPSWSPGPGPAPGA